MATEARNLGEYKDDIENHGLCYYCGKPTTSLAANSSFWPVVLCHKDEPGIPKVHCGRCVSERLERVTELEKKLVVAQAEIEQLIEDSKLDI